MKSEGKTQNEARFRTTIGGQALIEGIMMRGPYKQAIVVRGKDGLIVKEEEIRPLKEKHPILGWPLIRGVAAFIVSLSAGFKALMYSAEHAPEEYKGEESRLDKWIEKRFDDKKAEKLIIGVAMAIGIALAAGLFVLAPTLLTGVLGKGLQSRLLKNVMEGLIRIAIFVAYIWLVSRTKDIRRVFQYHGAEHKSIHCYEKGLELTVENIRLQPREHPRCGTSFLFVVMIVSLFVMMVVSWSNPFIRILIKLCLIPVIVGISYEINRWAGGHDNRLSAILTAPGKAMQKLTVYEPDDGMIEAAIEALKRVIPEVKGADKW
jgi:uncharacterized protein YqhQ